MPIIRMTAFGGPASPATKVRVHPGAPPYIVGNGEFDFACGQCGTILLQSVGVEQPEIHGVSFECPRCGVFSHVESN